MKLFCDICEAYNVIDAAALCTGQCANPKVTKELDRYEQAIELVKDDDKDPYVRDYLENEDKIDKRHGRNT